MEKWIERIAIALVAIFMVVACIGIYATWRQCQDIGGVAVRGIFGLECIKR